jgi:hypothetical protein
MSKQDMPLLGIPEGEFDEEAIKAERQRIIDEKMKIINEINSIKHPIAVTVFDHGRPWTFRNKAFHKMIMKSDDEMVKFFTEYLATDA